MKKIKFLYNFFPLGHIISSMKKVGSLLGLLIIFFLASAFFYARSYDAPLKTQTFFDRNRNYIGTLNPLADGFQIWTPLEEIPSSIIGKTIKQEDRFFKWHWGLNPVSTLKAFWTNIKQGQVVYGGSTITQQLAKNLIQEKSGKKTKRALLRKTQETFLAFGLELTHSKKWILERYLNSIYYGNQCYGITAASSYYFNKPLNQLTQDEAAFLVLLPKAPSRYSSYIDHKFHPPPNPLPSREGGFKRKIPSGRHFIEILSVQNKNQKIFNTTLDLKLQHQLEASINLLLAPQLKDDPLINIAAIVLDVKSGDVLAMIGSRDYFDQKINGQFNAALALRQPGSALKPFTYFAAFTKGFSPNTIVNDSPVSFPSQGEKSIYAYIPQNFDKRYHGLVTMRDALANSYNIPAVVTLNQIGLSYYFDLLSKFGFTSFNKSPSFYGLSLTLGSGEVSLLELTNAYATLARGGKFLPYRFLQNVPLTKPKLIIKNASFYAQQITSILSDREARLKTFGFSEVLNVEDYRVAVKTGTSYNHRDNWAIGYINDYVTGDYVVGVWVGHSDDSPLLGTTGATGAAPIWHAIMENLIRGSSKINMVRSFDKTQWVKLTMNQAHHVPIPDILSLSKDTQSIKIISPLPYTKYQINNGLPLEHQKILAKVYVDQKIRGSLKWYLDENFLQETDDYQKGIANLWLTPQLGEHQLKVILPNGLKQELIFSVEEK